MAIRLKARETYQNVGRYADSYRYVMMPELYTPLSVDKVISEASRRSGLSRGAVLACCEALGDVVRSWTTIGHSVALPGLGTMRVGVRARSVENVDEVKTSLISSRRIIFTPTTEFKDELADTDIRITCYDRNGHLVRRVNSDDPGFIEDEKKL